MLVLLVLAHSWHQLEYIFGRSTGTHRPLVAVRAKVFLLMKRKCLCAACPALYAFDCWNLTETNRKNPQNIHIRACFEAACVVVLPVHMNDMADFHGLSFHCYDVQAIFCDLLGFALLLVFLLLCV